MVLVYNKFWLNCVIIVLFGMLLHLCKSYVLIESDMMVESTLGNVQNPQTENVRSKRTAVKDRKRTWDFGVVPYEIDMTAEFHVNKVAQIEAAMRKWENSTCIIFVERNETEHEDFIRFTGQMTDSECECCSRIGKIGGPQDVAVNRCFKIGEIAHELGHTIGFQHEHQRPDRDEYVEINQDNYVGEDSEFDESFGKLSPDEYDTLNEPYDYDSIMHYPQVAGSKYSFEGFFREHGYSSESFTNKSLADMSIILPKKVKNRIGQFKRLSAIDIRKTNKLYNCPECVRSYFDQEAAFTSPEYYNNKSTKQSHQCEWRIKVTDGERIRLNITDLDIFETIDCKSDYLEVRDGYWHKSPLLGRFCGTNIPKYIVSTGHRMIINYVSNHTEHRGFAANYEAFCENGKCPACNQTYVDKYAAFTSPEYHYKSTNQSHRCEWRIVATKLPMRGRMRLNITDLDIFNSTDCQSDYLEVRCGFSSLNLLGRFCGNNTPDVITSSGDRMIINYVSNHTEHRGFALNYEIL